jgi:hypothetical protein
MEVGDLAIIYHTGDERQAVGLADVTRGCYVNPEEENPKLAVCDVRAKSRLRRQLRWHKRRRIPQLQNWELVRLARFQSCRQRRAVAYFAAVGGGGVPMSTTIKSINQKPQPTSTRKRPERFVARDSMFTVEQWAAMPDTRPHYELVDGRLIQKNDDQYSAHVGRR